MRRWSLKIELCKCPRRKKTYPNGLVTSTLVRPRPDVNGVNISPGSLLGFIEINRKIWQKMKNEKTRFWPRTLIFKKKDLLRVTSPQIRYNIKTLALGVNRNSCGSLDIKTGYPRHWKRSNSWNRLFWKKTLILKNFPRQLKILS